MKFFLCMSRLPWRWAKLMGKESELTKRHSPQPAFSGKYQKLPFKALFTLPESVLISRHKATAIRYVSGNISSHERIARMGSSRR